jgi:choline kinase
MKAVVLVAGVGPRLGNSLPKCLALLRPGYTGMLLLNGDVAFDPRIVPALLACERSSMMTASGRPRPRR